MNMSTQAHFTMVNWIIIGWIPIHERSADIMKCEKYMYVCEFKNWSSLSINALNACVSIYIPPLSSCRAPMLWFINLTVTTCHIQYTFLSLNGNLSHKKTDKIWKYSKSAYENDHRRLVGVQSINTERTSLSQAESW